MSKKDLQIIAIILAFVIMAIILRPDLFNINRVEQQQQTGEGLGPFGAQGWGTSQPPSQPPQIPDNPYLELSVNPNPVNRDETIIITITSNMPYAEVFGYFKHEKDSAYTCLGSIYLDGNGGFTQSMTAHQAGWWKLKVSSGTVESNEVDFTVLGLTIYQEKDNWRIGETYTGALTSTYRNWLVLIFVKWSNETLWDFYDSYTTDRYGIIPYGVLTEALSATGSMDVIAVMDKNDPYCESEEAMNYFEQVQFDGIDEDVLGLPSNIFDKSNVLTFHVSS